MHRFRKFADKINQTKKGSFSRFVPLAQITIDKGKSPCIFLDFPLDKYSILFLEKDWEKWDLKVARILPFFGFLPCLRHTRNKTRDKYVCKKRFCTFERQTQYRDFSWTVLRGTRGNQIFLRQKNKVDDWTYIRSKNVTYFYINLKM